jgi:outer membrane protein assembly factor BamB
MLSRSRNAVYRIVLILGLLVLMVVGTQFVKLVRSDQFPEDLIVPTFSVISPQNNVTYQDQVPLTCVTTRGGWKPGSPDYETEHSVGGVDWSYSLDGEDDVYVGANTTLTGLSAGAHQIVLRWWWGIDRTKFENWTTPIYFSVKVTEPFPTMLVATVSAALAALVAVGILVYLKKLTRKRLIDSSTRIWRFLKGVFKFRGTKYLLVFAVILSLILALLLHFGVPAINDWAMFHQGATHNGYSTSTAPNTNHVQWTYSAGGSSCSPAVVGDRVYTDSGKSMCCLNATTGESIWNYTLTGEIWFTSPAIADGKLYMAAYCTIYCLNATNGAFIWSYATDAWILSDIAVAYGKVYIGSKDNKVYCLDAATGASIWNFTTGYEVWASPAVFDGKVYIGSFDSSFYCLNASTGAKIWNYTTEIGYYFRTSAAVADGKVYVGSEDGNVYCLDSDNGALVWNYSSGSGISCSPAIAYGRVYAGNMDHYIFCVNAANGAFVWKYWTSDMIESSPAVADSKVYVGSDDGKIYCLNAFTGEFIWSYSTHYRVISSPAVANGKVYVGAGGKVIAFS